MLIDKNGKVTTEDENKWTPLHFAAVNGNCLAQISVHFSKQPKVI